MRVLFLTCQPPHHMAPPLLSDEQINCGPWFTNQQVAGRWLTRTTPFGDYDVAELAAALPADQQPDVIVCHVDCGFCLKPRNLSVFRGPKVLLAADSHWGEHAVSAMIRYALSEPFDRTVILYDRHHLELYRAAGVRNLHWFPGLTFAHPDTRITAANLPAATREPHLALVGKTGYHFRRQRLFSALITAGLPLAWREIRQRDAIAFYARSLIGFNAAMNGDLNLRVFETIAGGAMLLTDRLAPASGLDDLLVEGREKVSYRDSEELVTLARHYLAHPAEALAIGNAGKRWFDQNFSERHRRDAFEALVFDGRDHPAFALTPPGAPVYFGPGLLSLQSTLATCDFINERHRHAESFVIRIADQVPAGVAALASTLPRARVLSGAVSDGDPPVNLHVVSQRQFATHVGFSGAACWCWDFTPENAPSLEARAIALGLTLREKDAALFYPPAAPKSPGQSKAEQARQHLDFGDVQGALALAQEAAAAKPVPAEALLVLAELALEVGNRPLFEKMLLGARRAEPGLPRIALLEWSALHPAPRQPGRLLAGGWKAYESLDFNAAERYARRALEADATLAEAHFLLSLVYAHRRARETTPEAINARFGEQLTALIRAHELAPAHAEYLFQLGLVSREAGLPEQAARALRHATDLEPGHVNAWLALGEALLAQNLAGEAVTAFDCGLALAPRHTLLRQSRSVAVMIDSGNDFIRAIERLLSTESQSGQWQRLLAETPNLRAVRTISSGEILPYRESIQLLIAVGRAAVEATPELAAHGDLPTRTALITHQPWFDLDTRRLVSTAWDRGTLLVLLDSAPPAAPSLHVTGENFRLLFHRGVNLWDVCHYRIALQLRSLPQDLDWSRPEHAAVIRARYVDAVAFLDQADTYCEFYRPATVIIAQGYDLVDATLRAVAIQRGLRVVALENTFHRDRLLWDDTSGIAVHRNLARNYFWRHFDTLPAGAADRTTAIYLETLASLKTSQHASPLVSVSSLPGRDGIRTLAYIGQVGVDSAVLFGLRGFASQVEVIAALARYAADRGLRLLIKLHPKESPAYPDPVPYYRRLTAGWLDAHAGFQAARARLGENLLLDVDNTYNTGDIIRRAEVCVTINSQAGLEAALLDGEVVLCGHAFYGQLGFTHEATDAPSLHFILNRILDGGHRLNDRRLVRAFFHIFSELYCLPKSVESVARLIAGRPDFKPASTLAFDQRQAGLVYDVGMNNGDDTAYYLQLGRRVVAIEADPDLCAAARLRFETAIADGRLTIVNMGVAPQAGSLEFWICDNNRVWNSFDRRIASRDGLPHHAIRIPCQTFAWIVAHHGIPETLKIDIEGHDHFCIEALSALPDLPEYLSVELGDIEAFLRVLEPLGYREFKCISQYNFLPLQLPPSAEQVRFESGDTQSSRKRGLWLFPEGSSGPAGEDTPGRWLSSDEVRAVHAHYARLCREGASSPFWFGKSYSFWVDLHARRRPGSVSAGIGAREEKVAAFSV